MKNYVFGRLRLPTTDIEVIHATGNVVIGGSGDQAGFRVSPLDAPVEIRHLADDLPTLVKLFDGKSGKQIRAYRGPGATVFGLSVSMDGKYLAAIKSGVLNQSPAFLLIWNVETGDLMKAEDLGSPSTGDVAFSPTGNVIAYSIDNEIKFLRISPS